MKKIACLFAAFALSAFPITGLPYAFESKPFYVFDPKPLASDPVVPFYVNQQLWSTSKAFATNDDVACFHKPNEVNSNIQPYNPANANSSDNIFINENGYLSFQALLWPKQFRCFNPDQEYIDTKVVSGAMNFPMDGLPLLQYGRIEITAKIHDKDWARPQIWLLGWDKNNPVDGYGEIDMLESFVKGQARSSFHFHNNSKDKASQMISAVTNGGNIRNSNVSIDGLAFYTYTLIWTPDTISISVKQEGTATPLNTFTLPKTVLVPTKGTSVSNTLCQAKLKRNPLHNSMRLKVGLSVNKSANDFPLKFNIKRIKIFRCLDCVPPPELSCK